MFSTFRINARDYSSYIVGQHDAGLDLAPEVAEPQFGGSLGLGEGQAWIRDATNNKEIVVPLILSASGTDALHQLVRDINADLFAGAQVEIKLDQASFPTFFTLERGRLDVQYQFFLHQADKVRAMLRLWTRPFGHSGTARMIASGRFTDVSAAVNVLEASGIIGDADAFMNLRVRAGSQVASSGRLIAYGVSRFNTPVKEFKGGDFAGHLPAASSVTVGASGALGSQYLAIPVGPTVASGIAQRMYLGAAPLGGRSRVLAILRSGLYPPDAMRLYAHDRFGAILGATVIATQTDQSKWMVADLGEINFPAQPSGLEGVPSQQINIVAGGASGASVIASPALRLTGLVLLPLDISAGVMIGQGGSPAYYIDDFSRVSGLLDSSPNAQPGPGAWSRIEGYLGHASSLFTPAGMIHPVGATGAVALGATGFYALGSGARHTDVQSELAIKMLGNNASGHASGVIARMHMKAQAEGSGATIGVWCELQIGPSANHYLALLSHDGAATALHASKGLGGSSATAFYQGQAMKLTSRILGNLADVWLGTGPVGATPIISATHANIAQIAGHPALFGQGASIGLLNRGGPVFESFVHTPFGGTAPDAAAREWFKFESWPDGRAIRGATTFEQDVVGYLRGNFPRLPAMGSPAPSGAAYIVVLQGQIDDFVGNQMTDIEAYATERFTFMR